jgi:hypothetical protein
MPNTINLLFFVCSVVLSITWVIHICIYMLPQRPLYTFLNRFFIILEEAFGAGKPIQATSCLPQWVVVACWSSC